MKHFLNTIICCCFLISGSVALSENNSVRTVFYLDQPDESSPLSYSIELLPGGDGVMINFSSNSDDIEVLMFKMFKQSIERTSDVLLVFDFVPPPAPDCRGETDIVIDEKVELLSYDQGFSIVIDEGAYPDKVDFDYFNLFLDSTDINPDRCQ